MDARWAPPAVQRSVQDPLILPRCTPKNHSYGTIRTQMRVKGRLPLYLPPFCVFPRRGYVLHGNLIISVPSICQDLYQTQVQVGMESIKELRKHVSGVRIYDAVLPIRRRREKACPARLLLNSLRQALSGTLHKLPINCQLLGFSKTKQKKSLTRHTADKQTEGQTDRRWSLATISSGTITTSFPFRCDFELEKSNLKNASPSGFRSE